MLRKTLLMMSPLLLIGFAYAYKSQTAPVSIKGATIEMRRYRVSEKGEITEVGTKSAYLSATGDWSTVRRNRDGVVEQILVADGGRGGVFLVAADGSVATKVSNFTRRTSIVSPAVYRAQPLYKGETSVLGYNAWTQQVKDDNDRVSSESTSIPEFNYPVKTVSFDVSGQLIEEAISITIGEPDPSMTKLAGRTVVTGDITDQLLRKQKP